MPLTSQPIVSLLNGISQQPASMRHPSQAEAQVNCLSSLSVGLEKRPPTTHVAKLQSTPLPTEDQFWHTINRSSTAQYEVSIEDGDIRVFALSDGSEKTVNFTERRWFSLDDSTSVQDGPSIRLYIPTGTTTADFATSGIVAGDVVVWEESTTGAFAGEETTHRTDNSNTDAAVTITSGRWYRATQTATAGGGTIDAWIDWGDTSYLQATDPKNSFRAISVADYTFIANNTITVAMNSQDGATNGEVVTATVQTFGDLPSPMPGAGNIYKISGDEQDDFTTYYVKVDSTNTVYEEYMAPGDIDAFDQGTMPHTLVDNQDGTFTFGNGNWDARTVGDSTDTNKNPPFVGLAISEVFFFRNRFGVTAGETTSLSRIGTANGGYFNFWRETIPTVLDTDPIHLEAPHERNSRFIAASAFDEAMVLFSDEAQFVLNSEGPLTPASARIDVSTEFTAAGEARPVGIGHNAYFPVDAGDHVGVREYYLEADTAAKDAANVTAHIPRYIPANVTKMAGSTNEDLMCLLTSANTNRIYVYKFFWDGSTKAQSSWSYWELSDENTILNIDFVGPVLYLVVERSDGIYLEKISLNDDAARDDIGAIVHLDRREALTGVYDATNDYTTWTIASATSDSPVVVTGSSFGTPGEVPTVTYPSTTTIRATGDWSDGDCFVGLNYEQSYSFSEQFVRGDGETPDLSGRLQLRKFNVRYVNTGYFIAEVTATARPTQTYPFTGNVLGAAEFTLGDLSLYTGTFTFPVFSRSSLVTITLKNNTWKPATWLSAEWLGMHSRQSVIQ